MSRCDMSSLPSVFSSGTEIKAIQATLEGLKTGAGIPATIFMLYTILANFILPGGVSSSTDGPSDEVLAQCTSAQRNCLIIVISVLLVMLVGLWWKTFEKTSGWFHQIWRLMSWISLFAVNALFTSNAINCFYQQIDSLYPRLIPTLLSMVLSISEVIFTGRAWYDQTIKTDIVGLDGTGV